MIDPQTFATEGKAWIEAIGQVLTSAIGTAGTIGLAAIALFQNLRLKADIKDRLDRQSDRIDKVMIATQTSSEVPAKVEVINTEPVPTHETKI